MRLPPTLRGNDSNRWWCPECRDATNIEQNNALTLGNVISINLIEYNDCENISSHKRNGRELTEHTVVQTCRLRGHVAIVGLVVLTLHAGILHIGLYTVVVKRRQQQHRYEYQ